MMLYSTYENDCNWINNNAEMLLNKYQGKYIAVKDEKVVSDEEWLPCVIKAREYFNTKDFIILLCGYQEMFGEKEILAFNEDGGIKWIDFP